METSDVTEPENGAITLLSRGGEEATVRKTNTDKGRGSGEKEHTGEGRWSEELSAPTTPEARLERVKATADEAISRLAQALEEGRSEALTQYLGAVSRFHKYSLYNVLLIASQRPDATHVAGFRTWLKF